jgi:ligand-binding sensor domain-containing protein
LYRRILHIILFIATIITCHDVHAQYPHYITYDDESGLPSSNAFMIIQDKDGFIWLGLNAGLYRFDGVRYQQYKCATQKSSAMTGLSLSVSGGLYCFNFLSQIFYANRDTIIEIPHQLEKVNSIATDNKGHLYAGHSRGISQYNEKTKQWKHYSEEIIPYVEGCYDLSTRCEVASLKDTVLFMFKGGIGELSNNAIGFHYSPYVDLFPGYFISISHNGTYWMFTREHLLIYTTINGITTQFQNEELTSALKGRKITNVQYLKDDKLWITTYKGVIVFDPKTNEIQLLYPDISFSDVIIDREGSYWFATLQSGVLRVPRLSYLVWNNFENNRLVKLVSDNNHVYFANLNGTIGKIDIDNYKTEMFPSGLGADVQSFDYEKSTGAVTFNINNTLYQLRNGKISNAGKLLLAIKSRMVTDYGIVYASSHGTYVDYVQLDKGWSRTIKEGRNCLWISSNTGLLKLIVKDNKWQVEKKFLVDHQILSIDYDEKNEVLYAIDYYSNVYSFNHNDEMKLITKLPSSIQHYRIVYNEGSLYIATNNGLYDYHLQKQALKQINTFSGLMSNNVLDLTIVGNGIWLATNKGLQRIPLNDIHAETPLATIRLRSSNQLSDLIKLKNDEPLVLHPEVSCYSSNGKFEYAYRFNQGNEWYHLPSSIEFIEIQHIPWGNFELELKVLDHLGRDSENSLRLKGYAQPPLWRSWWLIITISFAFAALVFYIAYKAIRNVRKREHERSELVKSQLTALKAQMNPHFMYNTLNSIQGLILKQDIKSSNLYLSKFSQLMRKVLDASGKEYISLQEDIQILELYLSLEKLRFGSEFNYEIEIDPLLDPYMIQVPPLILQPFAENALKHGLLHKVGEKHLMVKYTLKKDLICIIEDNGIGRQRAMQIKDRQQDRHESFSSDAIRKRMDLLQSVTGRKFEIKYEDLHVASLATGTKVIVRIPLPSDME